MLTPYDVLGLRPDADNDAIRAAFRKAAKAHHPDLNEGDPALADLDRAVRLGFSVPCP
jgi:curved DNA-binding protein CbpA